MRNWVLTAYSAGTVSFCSGKALMGRRRSAKSSRVGIWGRARSRQSEGTLPFPFVDPEGTDVMVLEAEKARSNVTVRSPCRVEVVSSFKPIVRVGFYCLPGRRVVRYQRSLEGREDPRGKSEHLSRLEEEGNRAKKLK